MFGSIGIIGAGKVGSTLARLWRQQGYGIAAVYSRSQASAQRLSEVVGAESVFTPQAVLLRCDLTLLTVPDDAIEPLIVQITSELDKDISGKGVIHTSGARNARALSPLAAFGAMVGSLHPAFPFTEVDTPLTRLAGTVFAVEAEDECLRGWLLELVSVLDGRAWAISADQKGLYHAALVIASNYTVTLYALAEKVLMSLGAGRGTADAALNTLVEATVENVRQRGIPDALTGPLARGDAGTVAGHLRALEAKDAEVAEAYRQLARLSLPMLIERGIEVDPLVQVLNQEKEDENDNTRL